MTRILVIEDEKPVLDNLKEMLSAEGYEILLAGDGEEGVRLARVHQPDLILCDVRMPRLDGFTVLSILSHDRLTEMIPFIFLTARAEISDQRTGMGLGADDYITKPFTRIDLLKSIRKRLEKRHSLFRQAEERSAHIQESISRSLPDNLLSPIRVILGHAELLAESQAISHDPGQVRDVARIMRRAAAQLAHLVRSYMMYLELDSAQSDPQRRARLLDQRFLVDEDEVGVLLNGVARELGREDDLSVSLEKAEIKISEDVFFCLLEELADQVLRQSRLGNKLRIQGQNRASFYRLTLFSQIGVDPAALLLASREETSLGFMLARRIAQVFDGDMNVQDSPDGTSRIVVNLPRAVNF